MLNRRLFLAAVTFSSLGLPRLLHGAGESGAIEGAAASNAPSIEAMPDGDESAIVVCAIGNMARTSDAERLLMSRDDNDAARVKIIAEVVSENPALLLLLGNQVANGSARVEWQFYDSVTRPLRDAKIPVLAVRGNHDYDLSNGELANAEAIKRWPEVASEPHFRTIGAIAFIGVDTNLDMLSEAARRDQREKFVAKLKEYDEDSAIRGVIVIAHHPPYTAARRCL